MDRKRLTLKESAEHLKLKEPTVRKLYYSGKLPYIKLARRIFFFEDDLDRLIQDSYRNGGK
jgi:excisionase family DNA binding protein